MAMLRFMSIHIKKTLRLRSTPINTAVDGGITHTHRHRHANVSYLCRSRTPTRFIT